MEESFQERIEKAKEEYKKTGKMTHERACVLLSCQPTRELLNNLFDYFNVSKEDRELCLECLVFIEKKVGATSFINPRTLAAVIANRFINNRFLPQYKIVKYCGISKPGLYRKQLQRPLKEFTLKIAVEEWL